MRRNGDVMHVDWRSWTTRLNWRVSFAFFGATFVSVLLIAQIVRSGWCNDESAHIPAGLYHLETGRMDAYRVNPPLFRMLAALPLLVDHPKIDWFSITAPKVRSEYIYANNWILNNPAQVPRQLRLARSVMLLFFLLGAWTIYRWSSELYGNAAGWFGVALWSLSPDVITYSATVAPDLPAAATGLFACYWYWKWLYGRKNEIPWEVCFGVALATLSKFSWLFLFVLFPCLALIHDLLLPSVQGSDKYAGEHSLFQRWGLAWRRLGKLSIALCCTIVIINMVYGFEGTGQRLGDFEFLSTSLGGAHESQYATGNRYRGTLLSAIPVPLPCEMLQGIDYLKWEFEVGKPCYLFGEWKFRGWWYYYLMAISVKTPIGYFVLMSIGGISMVASYIRRQAKQGEWMIPLVAILFITLVSSQTGFTHHLRYVVPAFGFLYVIAARTMAVLPRWLAIVTIGGCLAGTVVFHATHLGQAHAHFNWLAGGPENGWRHLSLSNVDWGQSTFRMADWARSHPEKRPLTILFVSPLGDPSQLVADLNVATNVKWESLAADGPWRTPTSGWYLLSSEQLTHKENMYFRIAKHESWPFADTALFYVPQDER